MMWMHGLGASPAKPCNPTGQVGATSARPSTVGSRHARACLSETFVYCKVLVPWYLGTCWRGQSCRDADVHRAGVEPRSGPADVHDRLGMGICAVGVFLHEHC